jgi:hypothetical protein
MTSSGGGRLLPSERPELRGMVVVSGGGKTYKGRSYLPIPEPDAVHVPFWSGRGGPLERARLILPRRVVLGLLRQFCSEWDIESKYDGIARSVPWFILMASGFTEVPYKLVYAKGFEACPSRLLGKTTPIALHLSLEGTLREAVASALRMKERLPADASSAAACPARPAPPEVYGKIVVEDADLKYEQVSWMPFSVQEIVHGRQFDEKELLLEFLEVFLREWGIPREFDFVAWSLDASVFPCRLMDAKDRWIGLAELHEVVENPDAPPVTASLVHLIRVRLYLEDELRTAVAGALRAAAGNGGESAPEYVDLRRRYQAAYCTKCGTGHYYKCHCARDSMVFFNN